MVLYEDGMASWICTELCTSPATFSSHETGETLSVLMHAKFKVTTILIPDTTLNTKVIFSARRMQATISTFLCGSQRRERKFCIETFI